MTGVTAAYGFRGRTMIDRDGAKIGYGVAYTTAATGAPGADVDRDARP